MNDQYAVHDDVDESEEGEAFLQPTFIGIVSELSAITEGVLLPDSANIEAEAKVRRTIAVQKSILATCMLLMQYCEFQAYTYLSLQILTTASGALWSFAHGMLKPDRSLLMPF